MQCNITSLVKCISKKNLNVLIFFSFDVLNKIMICISTLKYTVENIQYLYSWHFQVHSMAYGQNSVVLYNLMVDGMKEPPKCFEAYVWGWTLTRKRGIVLDNATLIPYFNVFPLKWWKIKSSVLPVIFCKSYTLNLIWGFSSLNLSEHGHLPILQYF